MSSKLSTCLTESNKMPSELKGHVKLDRFQRLALKELAKGKSVVVSAPTGTGKTLIAEILANRVLSSGNRLVYTAPIKALSNQKYREFVARFGASRVGIVTGDIVINAEADLVVMTTEIFRNISLTEPERLTNVTHVVLDEFHWIDSDRGSAWEESVLFAPDHVKILALSATVPNAEELARWISDVRGEDVGIVISHDRAVPLEYAWFADGKVIDEFSAKRVIGRLNDQRRSSRGRYAGFNGGSRSIARLRMNSSHLKLIEEIAARKGFPVLYFVFSRAKVEEYAVELGETNDFLFGPDKQEVARRLEDYEGAFENRPELPNLLLKGIGYHHAGMSPRAKRAVEELYERRLLAVVYCTETFAVGVNFPAKSLVFDTGYKWDGYSHRPLAAREILQISGRAGRRGLDEMGWVYFRIDPDYPDESIKAVPEEAEPVKSQFNLSVNTVLNMIARLDDAEIYRVLSGNLAIYQSSLDRAKLKALLASVGRNISQCREHVINGSKDCPLNKRCNKRVSGRDQHSVKLCKEARKLKTRVKQLQRQLQLLPSVAGFKQQFDEIVDNLKHLGYLTDDGKLTEKGVFASCIHFQEIPVTELCFGGLFEKLSVQNAAGVLGALVASDRKEEITAQLRGLPRQAKLLVQQLNGTWYDYGFKAVKAWAEGCSLNEALNGSAMQEGDLIVTVRRVIDLARQIESACVACNFPLSNRIARNAKMIRLTVERDEASMIL